MAEPQEIETVKINHKYVFLAIGIVTALGMLLLSYSGGGMSEEEIRAIEAKKAADIEKAVGKNRPPEDYTGKLSPTIEHVMNAGVEGKWVHFSFSTGKEFYNDGVKRDSLDWDIAMSRAKIVSNGGKTNPSGKGAIAKIAGADLDQVKVIPSDGFVSDEPAHNPTETMNPAIDHWYVYDFLKHTLTPGRDVYVVRTADGNHAKMKIVSYYCGEAVACYKLRYRYDGIGKGSFD